MEHVDYVVDGFVLEVESKSHPETEELMQQYYAAAEKKEAKKNG